MSPTPARYPAGAEAGVVLEDWLEDLARHGTTRCWPSCARSRVEYHPQTEQATVECPEGHCELVPYRLGEGLRT